MRSGSPTPSSAPSAQALEPQPPAMTVRHRRLLESERPAAGYGTARQPHAGRNAAAQNRTICAPFSQGVTQKQVGIVGVIRGLHRPIGCLFLSGRGTSSRPGAVPAIPPAAPGRRGSPRTSPGHPPLSARTPRREMCHTTDAKQPDPPRYQATPCPQRARQAASGWRQQLRRAQAVSWLAYARPQATIPTARASITNRWIVPNKTFGPALGAESGCSQQVLPVAVACPCASSTPTPGGGRLRLPSPPEQAHRAMGGPANRR